MAYIKKRGQGKYPYSVIYTYTSPEDGKKVTKWESGFSKAAAEQRRDEINASVREGRFILPSNETVREFFLRWLPMQALKCKWSNSAYSGNRSCVVNHIIPHIGEIPMQKVSAEDIDKLYTILFQTKKGQYINGIRQRWTPEQAARKKCLSSTTIKEVRDILNAGFETALEWNLVARNPVPSKGPQKDTVEQKIWEADTVLQALSDLEDDPLLHLLVHITFIGSLREGEALGIRLEDINFDFKGVGAFSINKIIQRIRKSSLTPVNEKSILFRFPEVYRGKQSLLVLKTPKTKSSERIIFMTPQLKEEIRQRILQIEKDKALLGDRYFDYGLLICQPNGRPIEPGLSYKKFKRWLNEQEGKYPDIAFHGLRHSSSTYKLELSDGDIKSVQGDTGHKTANVLMNTYAHIRSQPRLALTKKLACEFYGQGQSPNSEMTETSAASITSPDSDHALSEQLLLSLMRKNPDLQKKLLCALLASDS